MLNKYNEASLKFKELEVTFTQKVLCFITSVLFAAAIVAGPIALIANLFIFNDYQTLVVIGIGIFVFLFLVLVDFFYLNGISKGTIPVKYILRIDALLFFVVVLVLICVVTVSGVLK